MFIAILMGFFLIFMILSPPNTKYDFRVALFFGLGIIGFGVLILYLHLSYYINQSEVKIYNDSIRFPLVKSTPKGEKTIKFKDIEKIKPNFENLNEYISIFLKNKKDPVKLWKKDIYNLHKVLKTLKNLNVDIVFDIEPSNIEFDNIIKNQTQIKNEFTKRRSLQFLAIFGYGFSFLVFFFWKIYVVLFAGAIGVSGTLLFLYTVEYRKYRNAPVKFEINQDTLKMLKKDKMHEFRWEFILDCSPTDPWVIRLKDGSKIDIERGMLDDEAIKAVYLSWLKKTDRRFYDMIQDGVP